jgi:hypothetical protein
MPVQFMSNNDLIQEYKLLKDIIYEARLGTPSNMLRIQALTNEIEQRGLEI